VKRGPIHWATFDFSAMPKAVAILVDDQSFIKEDGVNDANISFEVAARMATGQQPEVDDGLLDELIDDAIWVIRSLRQAKNGQGDNVILRLASSAARITEWHDPDVRVQGIVCPFQVEY
jgi:hypothetical protein